jgi:predicted Zn-dependent peptidase
MASAMASKRRPAIAAAALTALLGTVIAGARAQAPAAGANAHAAVVAFTAPDGSRFVLVPHAVPVVHWAVATFVDASDEPRGLEGLAATTARASLGGTWQTGSADVEKERQALANLDEAWQAALHRPGDAAAAAQVSQSAEVAAGLGDSAAFRRVLAAMPAHRPEVVDRDPVCILVLTTLPDAIGDVGRRLVERRDQQALRDLQTMWMADLRRRTANHLADPMAAVRAEVLALALPNHVTARSLEQPQPRVPTRAEAMATFEATQHPDRTVHVLLGDFDTAAVKETLSTVFAAAPSRKDERPATLPPRPFQSLRRSTVPGVKMPMVALAWVLPPIDDRFVLEAAALWLGGGLDSRIGQELQRGGRSKASVQCRAPWPRTVDGASLLLLEVTDPDGTDQLSDLVMAAVRTAVAAAPSPDSLRPVLAAMQRRWCTLTDDSRQLALELVETAVLWPRATVSPTMPDHVSPEAVQALLAKTFSGQPVVVEGRP